MMNILFVTTICMILFRRINSNECFTSNNPDYIIQCDYCLSQTNFKFGTYRIQNSGIYCLTEDIIFNPLPPSSDISTPNTDDPLSWFPQDNQSYPGCISMKDGPFALGFFSVIDIETNNVIIDLNGYKISYHFKFYLQQRFGSIIEISNQPFLPSTKIYTNFGNGFIEVNNIIIRNGELGLTSHHGIHSNNATNITIENLSIYDFEVAGIQLNGFYHAQIKNVNIGPSLQDAPLTSFFSNARYLILALRQLINGIYDNNLPMPALSFSYSNDSLTLKQIKDNLVQSMDIIFTYYTGNHDDIDEYYTQQQQDNAMKLFKNYDNLPDGSSMYGIILNSYDIASNDFGYSNNNGKRQGNNVKMSNITLHDMTLKTREVIGVNFAECHEIGYQPIPKVTKEPTPAPEPELYPAVAPTYRPTRVEYRFWYGWYSDYYDYFYDGEDGDDQWDRWPRRRLLQDGERPRNEYESISIGPFGDVMDITMMVPDDQVESIQNYDGTQDLSYLDYIGNPLSDAQIALYIYGEYLQDGTDFAYTSFISRYLLIWAIRDMQFPSECVTMIRNHDNMHQPHKGVIGIRMDGIEGAEIDNISITNLYNKADNDYDRQNDIFDTNVRGISIIDGDLSMFGYNIIDNLVSSYGTSTGLDIMDDDSYVDYHENSTLYVTNLVSKSELSGGDSEELSSSIKMYIIIGSVGMAVLLCSIFCIWRCCCKPIDDEEENENENKNGRRRRRSSISVYTTRVIRRARNSISLSRRSFSDLRKSIDGIRMTRGGYDIGGEKQNNKRIEKVNELERIRSGSVLDIDGIQDPTVIPRL